MGIAIITGASSGIGAEFVKQIFQRDDIDEIWAIARREDRLETLRAQVSDKIMPIPLDLARKDSINVVKELLKARAPDVKLLVNAAGFGKYGTYSSLTDDEVSGMIDVNDCALVLMSYAVIPYMSKGAQIILMGSQSSFQPLPYFDLYASTKAFVVHFGRALNIELKPVGISVTTVCPGYVDTEFINVAKKTGDPDSCQNFNPIYAAPDVVRKALKDARRHKDMSVYGAYVKMSRILCGILPHSLLMKVWLKIK